jgi:pimeloyl-ACP methyl ester carboxylesterase
MFPAGDSQYVTSYLTLTLRGAPIVIRAIETGDASAQNVVVCVHGWACSVYSFRRLMPLLAESGMRAIAIDLPGHGLSDKPGDARFYTLDAQVECVLAAMDALGVKRAVLAGHSMGGPISARAAVLAPERVEALALLAPAGFGTEWEMWLLRAITPRPLAPVLPHLLRHWMFTLMLKFAYGDRIRPTRHDVDEYWAPTQFPGFVRAMWDLLHCFQWSAGIDCGFGTLTLPAAVLDGARDNFVIRRWVKRYAEVLAGATLTVIPDCGHVVPEEAPEITAKAILGLLGLAPHA